MKLREPDINTNLVISEEKACCASLLKRWQRELLIDESRGDTDAMELDRRMLDYYLDQYHSSANWQSVANEILRIASSEANKG